MRDRLLIRHFLWRFMDHDLISPNADRRVALSAIGGTGIALSLFIAVLLALKYQFDSTMPAPPGIASLNALDDRFLFTSTSMLVMAFAAVAEWDALALDPRDTAVLGVLRSCGWSSPAPSSSRCALRLAVLSGEPVPTPSGRGAAGQAADQRVGMRRPTLAQGSSRSALVGFAGRIPEFLWPSSGHGGSRRSARRAGGLTVLL